jgi:hypothetical protein
MLTPYIVVGRAGDGTQACTGYRTQARGPRKSLETLASHAAPRHTQLTALTEKYISHVMRHATLSAQPCPVPASQDSTTTTCPASREHSSFSPRRAGHGVARSGAVQRRLWPSRLMHGQWEQLPHQAPAHEGRLRAQTCALSCTVPAQHGACCGFEAPDTPSARPLQAHPGTALRRRCHERRVPPGAVRAAGDAWRPAAG